MKTIFLIAGLIGITSFSFAQPNNPLNQRGVDYLRSLDQVVNDVNRGYFTEFTDESIRQYAMKIPLKTDVNLDLASQVYKLLKTPGFQMDQFMKTAVVSEATKELTYQLFNPSLSGGQTIKEHLVKLTDQVNKVKLDKNEKEILQTLIAIYYHSQDRTDYAKRGCIVQMAEFSTEISATACITALAAVGAYVGIQVCGLACGLGGAIIGGLVGAVTTLS